MYVIHTRPVFTLCPHIFLTGQAGVIPSVEKSEAQRGWVISNEWPSQESNPVLTPTLD